MAFETFTSGRRITKEPSISIIKQGNFNLNSGSMNILKQQNTTHVQLMFDPDTRRIAFKPCPKDAQGAYALREVKELCRKSRHEMNRRPPGACRAAPRRPATRA